MSPEQTRATNWTARLAAYRTPRTWRSVAELAVTTAPLLALWGAALWLAELGRWWAALPVAVVASLFVLRLFVIQHDCGHGAFFKSRALNDWVGRVLGVFTLTPYAYWRDSHAIHHATSGDLDRRDVGALETRTVAEYRAMPRLQRLAYRVLRHPLTLFGFAPAFVYFVQQRVPVGLMRRGWKPWVSTLGSSVATGAVAAGFAVLFGWAPALIVPAVSVLLAATVGIWLFYVQHQYEGVRWSRSAEWKPQAAALHGSSHYVLPGWLAWFTANIGVHHVHHLQSRIPCYRLPEVLRDHPELNAMSRLTVRESLRCVKLALWDEDAGRMVSFREANRPTPTMPVAMAA